MALILFLRTCVVMALAFGLAVCMGLLEILLGRLEAADFGGYVAYLVGVAARRELYLDDPEPLWRDS